MQGYSIPRAIHLYDEGITGVSFKQIEGFIRENFGKIKISIDKLKKEAVLTKGLLFDFLGTQRNFRELSAGCEENSCQIILTKKLFATQDEFGRPHLRASIYSFPSVISTSGIVEGPAKPKEYYLYKQKYTQLRIWEKEEPRLKEKFKPNFIDYADKRLTEVLKGYAAQAVFFYLTQDPFCAVKTCRLFNAHWQKDLIRAQITSGKFCRRHREFLKTNILRSEPKFGKG